MRIVEVSKAGQNHQEHRLHGRPCCLQEREREMVCVGLHIWTSYFFLPLILKDFNGSSFLPAVLALFPLLRLCILVLRSLFSLVLATPTKPTSFAVSPFRPFTGTK